MTVVLLGGSIVAALVLAGRSDDEPPVADTAVREEVATPEPTAAATPALERQVQTLDGLMKRSARGRAAAVRGDIPAATANRSDLLRRLRRLQREATDDELRAAVVSFTAAIRESLRQNRECGNACPTRDLERVTRLKQAALRKINPLLRAQGLDPYRPADI